MCVCVCVCSYIMYIIYYICVYVRMCFLSSKLKVLEIINPQQNVTI